MLDGIGLEPGYRVLDLAAGTGDTSLMVARRVGPQGSVLAVDISEAMLREAREAAASEGLTNVETLVSDIVELDVPEHSFDAAISRFGLMFLTNPTEGLRRVRAAMKASARLAAVVWSTEQGNPFMRIPLETAEQFGQPVAAGSPMRRAVSLGGSGVFEQTLRDAGFTNISVQPVAIPRDFASLDDAVDAIEQNSSVVRELLGRLDQARHAEVRADLRRRLSEFVDADTHCRVPGEALLGVATRA
jgi:SAM-dependent methyltransferase